MQDIEILQKIAIAKFILTDEEKLSEFRNGGYSYNMKIIETIASITDCDKYRDIYISNMKETFQKGEISNLSFDECITYFHWLWSAEKVAVGTIKIQIEKGYFLNILEQLEKYLKER